MDKGKVWLVGAGPGDIGLFTLKGMNVTQRPLHTTGSSVRIEPDARFLGVL